jgi:hypothetical protein
MDAGCRMGIARSRFMVGNAHPTTVAAASWRLNASRGIRVYGRRMLNVDFIACCGGAACPIIGSPGGK